MKKSRPGYLAGYQSLVPKSTRLQNKLRRTYSGLGYFGKGAFVPMPNAPPGGVPMEDAVHAQTGQTYMQDPRCPEGEKMVTKMEPCEGQDCCDGADCDPPGTPYPEDECEDDPNYQQKAPPPPPPPQAASAPAQAPVAVASDSAGSTEAQVQELQKLEQEAAETESMVTQAPTLAPPSAYTGTPPPSYIPPRKSSEPSPQDQIAELVAQHQSRRPAPAPRPRVIARPAPVREAPSLDIFSWLKTTLFGSTDGFGSWTDNKAVKYGVPLLGLTLVGFYLYQKKK
jgi:hypothetical protein